MQGVNSQEELEQAFFVFVSIFPDGQQWLSYHCGQKGPDEKSQRKRSDQGRGEGQSPRVQNHTSCTTVMGRLTTRRASRSSESLQVWGCPGTSLFNNPPRKQLAERSEVAARTAVKGSRNQRGDFCQHAGMSEGTRDPGQESVLWGHRGQRALSLAEEL